MDAFLRSPALPELRNDDDDEEEEEVREEGVFPDNALIGSLLLRSEVVPNDEESGLGGGH